MRAVWKKKKRKKVTSVDAVGVEGEMGREVTEERRSPVYYTVRKSVSNFRNV